MNTLTMMTTAVVLFALAAVGGLTMAVIRFRGADRPSSAIAMAHGLLAAAGLTLLLYAAVTTGVPAIAAIALVIFIIVAVVGVALNLWYHDKLRPLPKTTIVVHGIAAVVAFLLLLLALYR
jgi:hypothetical protein